MWDVWGFKLYQENAGFVLPKSGYSTKKSTSARRIELCELFLWISAYRDGRSSCGELPP